MRPFSQRVHMAIHSFPIFVPTSHSRHRGALRAHWLRAHGCFMLLASPAPPDDVPAARLGGDGLDFARKRRPEPQSRYI